MNTASQNFPHHLGILRGRMLHPTDYEKAMEYFLEEFAGDIPFMQQSEPDTAPHLLALVEHIAGRAIGQKSPLSRQRAFLLRAHEFYHGNAAIDGRVVLFFYFKRDDTGVLAIVPGPDGKGAHYGRFKVAATLPDPRLN